MSPEAWRPIPGYPSYEASDHGNVRRGPEANGRGAKPGHVLAQQEGGGRDREYLRVRVSENGKPQTRLVHILVCAAFHGRRPSAGYTVDHRDTDRKNNRPGNLRWEPGPANFARGANARWGNSPEPTGPGYFA